MDNPVTQDRIEQTRQPCEKRRKNNEERFVLSDHKHNPVIQIGRSEPDAPSGIVDCNGPVKMEILHLDILGCFVIGPYAKRQIEEQPRKKDENRCLYEWI